MSLVAKLYNPGIDALDDQSNSAHTQQRRLQAGIAFLQADSDAKLRRAMAQEFYEGTDLWYSRI
jgi:hypothetical protein